MTVSTSYAPLGFSGNGSTTAFSVTWQFFSGTLNVVLITAAGVETTKTITTHYTVSGGTDSNGLPATGTVTMLTAPAVGEYLVIRRNTAKTQASTWAEHDGFPQKTVEAALDKLTLLAQEAAAGGTDEMTGDVMTLNAAGAINYWDAESHIIRNVATPTANSDAATKEYVDDAVLGELSSVTITGGTITDAVITDTSSTAGSAASHWSTYYGNPGTAKVHRLNRLLVGPSADASSDIPLTTSDWVDDLLENVTAGSQLISTSAVGILGLTGAARTSDYRTWLGSASAGSQGVTGIAYNDDTTGNPIAAGVVGIAVHANNCTGVTLNQFDINNMETTPVDVTPYSGVTGGHTFASGFTAGAYASLALGKVSAAGYIAEGVTANAIFRKGFVFFEGALDATVGSSGNGVALELARQQSIRWLNNGGTTDAEVFGGNGGLYVLARLNLGFTGSVLGELSLAGSTSGTVLLTAQATAGTPTLTLPNTSGTLAASATAPISLDTTTGGLSLQAVSAPGGRLTLTSATPVMTSNTTGQATIYYTPHVGNIIPIYDGTKFVSTVFTELTNATAQSSTGKAGPAAVTTNSNYDLFVWNDSGTIRLTRGPAWSSDTSRGTGAGTTELDLVTGIYTNKLAITNGPAANRGTYVGTVRSNGSSQIDWIITGLAAGGTAASLSVWNAHNRVRVGTVVADSTDSWAYTTSSWRAANNSSTMRVGYVIGLASSDTMEASYSCYMSGSATGGTIGVGYDSTTAFSGQTGSLYNGTGTAFAQTQLVPALGYHYASAIEYGAAGMTFYGDAGSPTVIQNSLQLSGFF